MADHTSIRLEAIDGTTIAYLAPNFRVEPNIKNQLFAEDMPDDESTVIEDVGTIRHEVTVQGEFVHSENLPPAHRDALEHEDMFGKSPVTPRDQVNRIMYYLWQGGPFAFFDEDDEYTALVDEDVDRQNGIYPTVAIDEFRSPSEGGLARHEYVIKMIVGVEA